MTTTRNAVTRLCAHGLLLIALTFSTTTLWALDAGPLRIVKATGQPAYGEIALSDAAGFDLASFKARLAAPKAYEVAGMKYDPALGKMEITAARAADGRTVLRIQPLPAGLDRFDLLLVLSDRMKVSLAEYRIDLRGSRTEFAAALAGSGLAGQVASPAPTPVPAPAAAPAPTAATAVPAPAPVPAPAAAASDAAGAPDEVRAAVLAWAEAWSRRDVDAYIASYVPDYNGRGQRSVWLAERRERIRGRELIEVKIDDLRLTPKSRGRVAAKFVQSYRSDVMSERGHKELVLVRVGTRWLIAREVEAK